jgi:hypothetical protein
MITGQCRILFVRVVANKTWNATPSNQDYYDVSDIVNFDAMYGVTYGNYTVLSRSWIYLADGDAASPHVLWSSQQIETVLSGYATTAASVMQLRSTVTATSSWTVPAGVNTIYVIGCGGGGGGSGYYNNAGGDTDGGQTYFNGFQLGIAGRRGNNPTTDANISIPWLIGGAMGGQGTDSVAGSNWSNAFPMLGQSSFTNLGGAAGIADGDDCGGCGGGAGPFAGSDGGVGASESTCPVGGNGTGYGAGGGGATGLGNGGNPGGNGGQGASAGCIMMAVVPGSSISILIGNGGQGCGVGPGSGSWNGAGGSGSGGVVYICYA